MPLPWERRLPVAHPAHPPAVQRTPALLRHRARIPPAARLLEPQARPRQAQAWEAPPDLAGAVAAASAAVAAALAVAVAVVAALAVAAVVAVPSAVAARPSVARPSLASPAKTPKHRSRNIRSRSTTTSGSLSTTPWK